MRHLVTTLLAVLAFVVVVLLTGAALDRGPGIDAAPLAAGGLASLAVVAARMPRQGN